MSRGLGNARQLWRDDTEMRVRQFAQTYLLLMRPDAAGCRIANEGCIFCAVDGVGVGD